MDNIFEIKFSFEQKIKDSVIYKFSNKQGGDYNVFSFHWQCFVWAAIIGFLRNERRPLTPPKADQVFSLNTMFNNGGEKDAQALICLAIARAGTLDIMKNPQDAINLINEYANGGFYHIMKLMENGENSFNDLEKVKQEIFSRNYDELGTETPKVEHEPYVVPEEAYNQKEEIKEDFAEDFNPITPAPTARKSHRWTFKEEKDMIGYFQAGMTIDQLARLFGKDEESVREKLIQKGELRIEKQLPRPKEKQEIVERVNAIMAAKAGINANEIKPENYYDELGANSMQCIEVLVEIEKEFDISIPSKKLMYVTTMQHVYDLVEQTINT